MESGNRMSALLKPKKRIMGQSYKIKNKLKKKMR